MKWTAGFLVIRVHPGDWRRALVLPFPLFVIEEALEAVASIVRLVLWFGWKPPSQVGRLVSAATLSRIAHAPALILRELRASGPLVLAEVQDGRTHVSVRVL